MYITYLSAAKEASSLIIATKYVANSYTLINEPYPQQMYAENPSPTRDTEYQIGR